MDFSHTRAPHDGTNVGRAAPTPSHDLKSATMGCLYHGSNHAHAITSTLSLLVVFVFVFVGGWATRITSQVTGAVAMHAKKQKRRFAHGETMETGRQTDMQQQRGGAMHNELMT